MHIYKNCGKCKGLNGSSNSYCRTCHNEYQKAYYKKNPYSINSSMKRRKELIRNVIKESKNIPCADCKKLYPYFVMDFDHVRGKKSFGIANGGTKYMSMKKLKEEISKCEVVCANCHRIRTFTRNNSK